MRALLLETYEGLRIALRAIWVNKLRAMLTTLGIIIGIVSVTAMFTTINGIERGFDRSMAMLGTNVLHVQKWPWFSGGDDWWRYINRPNISDNLTEVIEARSRYAAAVAPVAQTMRSVQYRDRSLSGVSLQASTPALSRTREINLSAGRFYNEFDHRLARNVCVIGADVAEGLFPVESPLGKTIRIGGQSFEVIGVLAPQGKFLGLFSFDTQIQLPLSTFKKLYGSRRSYSIEIRVESPELMNAAEDEIVGILRAARRLGPMDENDFVINRQEAFEAQFGTMKLAIYGVGLFLTALSLLVGGIGVMNIMFVSVKERTREIGIRKAVGARRRTIMMQFLIEAVLVCSLGGVIGILLSLAVTALINSFFTAYLSVGTIFLAFTICVTIGILFGFIPARKAARAHPIEALRYE